MPEPPPPHPSLFHELLRKLNAEHQREVRELRTEIIRLQDHPTGSCSWFPSCPSSYRAADDVDNSSEYYFTHKASPAYVEKWDLMSLGKQDRGISHEDTFRSTEASTFVSSELVLSPGPWHEADMQQKCGKPGDASKLVMTQASTIQAPWPPIGDQPVMEGDSDGIEVPRTMELSPSASQRGRQFSPSQRRSTQFSPSERRSTQFSESQRRRTSSGSALRGTRSKSMSMSTSVGMSERTFNSDRVSRAAFATLNARERWGVMITYVQRMINISEQRYASLGSVWQKAKDQKRVTDQSKKVGLLEGMKMALSPETRVGASILSSHSMTPERSSSRGEWKCCCPGLIMHPNSTKRLSWDLAGTTLLMHDLIMIPMSVFTSGTTGMPDSYNAFLTVFDLTSAIFWTLDIIVSFMTGYHSQQGYIEMIWSKIAKHYLKSWFPMDLLIATVDWVSFAIGMGSTSEYMRLGKTVSRIMRVLRLLRFLKLNHALKELMERINSEYVLTGVNLMKIVVFIIIINHYIACFWYGISQWVRNISFGRTWAQKFLKEQGGEYYGSISYAYSTALHWSLTQFTPASMEVVPQNPYERMFNVVVILTGLISFSSFVSSITQAMTHIRNINARQVHSDSEMRRYFSEHKISHELAGRVWFFLRRNRISTAGRRMKEQDVSTFKVLPERIREELRHEVFMPILSMHPIFPYMEKHDPLMMRQICKQALTEKTFIAGQQIIGAQLEVKTMLFIVHGSADYVLSEEETIPVHRGCWACEVALWSDTAVLAGPICSSLNEGCELISLDVPVFQQVAEGSDVLDFLAKYAAQFVKQFNSSFEDPTSSDILFNDILVIQDLFREALHLHRSENTYSQGDLARNFIVSSFFGNTSRWSGSSEGNFYSSWRNEGFSAAEAAGAASTDTQVVGRGNSGSPRGAE